MSSGISWDQVLTAMGGAGIGGVLLKLLDVFASRRQTVVHADVTLSAEARAWVEQFRAEMMAMADRHREELTTATARIDAMEQRLQDREKRVLELESENVKLEREVKRLTKRVADLEGVGGSAGGK